MEKYKHSYEALNDLGWSYLTNRDGTFKDVRYIFDPFDLNEDKVPKIITNQKSILVLDNHDWNETYLIDVVSSILKESEQSLALIKDRSLGLYYCDDMGTRAYIELRKKVNNGLSEAYGEEYTKEFERDNLHPMVMVINPETNCIVAIKEPQICKISESDIRMVLQFLDNDFCHKMKEEKTYE